MIETQQTSYKIAKDLVGNPLHNLIDVELPGFENSNIPANFKRNINIIWATIISSTRYSKKHSPEKLEQINLSPPQYKFNSKKI